MFASCALDHPLADEGSRGVESILLILISGRNTSRISDVLFLGIVQSVSFTAHHRLLFSKYRTGLRNAADPAHAEGRSTLVTQESPDAAQRQCEQPMESASLTRQDHWQRRGQPQGLVGAQVIRIRRPQIVRCVGCRCGKCANKPASSASRGAKAREADFQSATLQALARRLECCRPEEGAVRGRDGGLSGS